MRKMDELHYKANWSGGEGSGLEKVNALIVRMNRIYDAYENHLNQFHKQTQEPERKEPTNHTNENVIVNVEKEPV